MIASIRGTIEAKATDRLVVTVGGIGIRVLTPRTVVEDTGSVGESVHLLTYLQVREDALTLYGFTTQDQLRLFELLISVSGVGPNHALGVLSLGSTEAVERAIADENTAYLSQVPRLGRRLAARIALELKGKVSVDGSIPATGGVALRDSNELIAALMELGITAGEAQAALQSLPHEQELSTEEKLRLALSYFNRI